MVWKAAGISTGNSSRNNSNLKIIYCSRSSSPTRDLKDEEELLSRLSVVASASGAEVALFEKKSDRVNHTSSSPLHFVKETVQMFESASIVVGVHGASLANIAFSRPGTTVVEMGMESLPQASHYRHLSQSLGLKHVDVFLAKDARSLGATKVQLRKGGLEEVVSAVKEALMESKSKFPEKDLSEL